MRLFFILLAFVLAVASGLAFYSLSNKEEDVPIVVDTTPQDVQPATTYILVARQDIPVGKKIDVEDIDRQEWPQSLLHPDFVASGGEAQLIDHVARTPFVKGEPLAVSRMANPNDPGFLAAQLKEGMRAITIPINDVSGINGFVFPGDRVDVLVNHAVSLNEEFEDGSRVDADGRVIPRTRFIRLPVEDQFKVPTMMTESLRRQQPSLDITEALVANVKVLAVGQQSYQYENAQAVPVNITLEVSTVQAGQLHHAIANRVSFTLALRSLSDADDKSYPRAVSDADMSRLTPPSYFPYMYDTGNYGVETLDLEPVDYNYREEKMSQSSNVNVIRGTRRETVKVNTFEQLQMIKLMKEIQEFDNPTKFEQPESDGDSKEER